MCLCGLGDFMWVVVLELQVRLGHEDILTHKITII